MAKVVFTISHRPCLCGRAECPGGIRIKTQYLSEDYPSGRMVEFANIGRILLGKLLPLLTAKTPRPDAVETPDFNSVLEWPEELAETTAETTVER